MTKFSDGFASSVIKGVRKKCFASNIAIPSDHLILLLLKQFILCPEIDEENADAEEVVRNLTELIVIFLKTSCSPSIVTLKMQIYFSQNHLEKAVILNSQQEQVYENIRPLQRLIFSKAVKNKEDYDQLYHHISCMVVLMNGFGDPTDNATLKETIVALKSIVTSKDLARFTSKIQSLKEKSLHDISRIVAGILIYNRRYSQGEDDSNDMITELENSLQKYHNFLESSLLKLDKRTASLIHLFLKFYSNNEVQNVFSPNFGNEICDQSNESRDTGKYIKSYIICMQQCKLYFRMLMQNISSLIEEFNLCSDQLQKRLLRIHKTVKHRNAVPVTESQFKDVAFSWNKMLEISTLLNNVADIISHLRHTFEKVNRPQLDLHSDWEKSHLNCGPDLRFSQSSLPNLDSENCKHILPDDNPDFCSLNVELEEYCIIMFVDTNGILAQGIKEYGLIKYQNSYFSFSSLSAMIKFCLTPDVYVESLKKLAFIWPETINLLHLQKWLEKKNTKIKEKRGLKQNCLKEAGVQTEVHPLEGLELNERCSKFSLLKGNLTKIEKNCQTHSVQTDISYFRKNVSTQTAIRSTIKSSK